jgi:hypothetical protein
MTTHAPGEQAVPEVRIGIVGIESTHVDGILRYLNRSGPANVRLRAAAIVAGEPERTREVAALGGIRTIVDDPADLVGLVDAVIVTTRDGAQHRRPAELLLEAGIPVWVDKPLATDAADARAIVDTATRRGVPMTSFSALRWLADTEWLMRELPSIAPLQELTITGPADEHDPHGGLFFYGIHLADLAQRLVPGDAEDVEVQRSADTVELHYRSGDVRVNLRFVRPSPDGHTPFHVSAIGTTGAREREIAVGPQYLEPGVDAFARMLADGSPPVPPAQMIAAVSALAHVGHPSPPDPHRPDSGKR